jgi:L-seryl-tRNA(Ser) seleniumtransferase
MAVAVARRAQDVARRDLARGVPVDLDAMVDVELRRMEAAAGITVINATGVLLHTNLGRAPWSDIAIARASSAGAGYSALELDVINGDRGRRGRYVETLLCELTGAESALVVNNNAAAVLLALAACSGGQGVAVSRGELIEIGGAYRLPTVMEMSGARLVEVGTTNRTRVGDYVTALQTHRCGAILKVHPSNFRIDGFTEEATISELAALGASTGIPVLYDLGSGLLDAEATWLPDWLRSEPGARQSFGQGADLVMFSGDKLLGGPQAGIVVGRSTWVERLASHPLSRALRVDGVTYAALAATLEAYLGGGPPDLPLWSFALTPVDDLRQRAEAIASAVGGKAEETEAAVGGGSAPGVTVPSHGVRIIGGHDLYLRLLVSDPPVLAIRDSGDLVIDLRAVKPEDDRLLVDAILRCR